MSHGSFTCKLSTKRKAKLKEKIVPRRMKARILPSGCWQQCCFFLSCVAVHRAKLFFYLRECRSARIITNNPFVLFANNIKAISFIIMLIVFEPGFYPVLRVRVDANLMLATGGYFVMRNCPWRK